MNSLLTGPRLLMSPSSLHSQYMSPQMSESVSGLRPQSVSLSPSALLFGSLLAQNRPSLVSEVALNPKRSDPFLTGIICMSIIKCIYHEHGSVTLLCWSDAPATVRAESRKP